MVWSLSIYYKTKIECHCGFTYSRNYLTSVDESGKRYYIGWDYAHYGDYTGYDTMFPSELIMGGKMYNTAHYEQVLIGQCPKCSQEVQEGMNFCMECGQAIDWRVGNE